MTKFKKGNTKGRKFSSENQPSANGRRRNVYTVLKDKGYSTNDISTAAGEMAFYTESEAREVATDTSAPIIIRIMAHNYLNALSTGYIKDIEHPLILAAQSAGSQPDPSIQQPTVIKYQVLPPEQTEPPEPTEHDKS